MKKLQGVSDRWYVHTLGKAPPCVDNIPDCADYGQEVCGNSAFQGFLRENCRKFCGFCTGEYTE